MAFVEQLIYGANPETGQPGRYVLARSPGMGKECASEIVRLCEGWGGAPEDENFRPVLLSFPLSSRMPSLPGRLFTVIQISAEPLPIFHATVISEIDYNTFNCNPFALAMENVFLKQWASGIILARREVKPTSLAPLVSPLPSESDADLVEEALHQLLARDKLLLPLEVNDAKSDRFLALLVTALPLQLKRRMRFASLATSEVNKYTLAAIYRPGNTFSNWNRLLMASLSGPISSEMTKFLESVRKCLVAGDLLGLENVSRQSVMDIEKKVDIPLGTKAETLAATLPQTAQAGLPARDWGKNVVAAQMAPPVKRRSPRRTVVRRHSIKRRATRKIPTWIMGLVAIMLLGAGVSYWLSLSGLDKVKTIFSGSETGKIGSTLLGVVDVGAMYDSELQDYLLADPGTPGSKQDKVFTEALTALKVGAAEDLGQQARLFVDLVSQGIHHTSKPSREADRLTSLGQRGAVLEHELQRLLLAYYSLENGVLWRDLSSLSESQLSARWDSLRHRQPDRVTAIAEELTISGQIADVRYARRQVANMARLVTLFVQEKRGEKWMQSTERAAKALTLRSLSPSAAAYRACAIDLVRLKKAEDAANFGSLAFVTNYEERAWLPASITKILRDLRSHVSKYGVEVVPPLVVSTLSFYDALFNENLAWDRASPQQLSNLIKNLASNQVVEFDSDQYADHVERVRFAALASLTGRQHDPRKLPSHFFPAKDRGAAQAFQSLLVCEPSAEEWQEVAQLNSLPFYARWASAQILAANQARAHRNTKFDQSYSEVVTVAVDLDRQARQGEDWTETYVKLKSQLEILREEYSGHFLNDMSRREKLNNIENLATSLNQSIPLALTTVTVRMAAAILKEPTEVRVEILDKNGQVLGKTKAFEVGPAAPAGTGWVGSLPIALDLELRPDQPLRIIVLVAGSGRTLLTTDYGIDSSLTPAALVIPQPCQSPVEVESLGQEKAGSIAFKITDGYWRRLELPDMNAVESSLPGK